jgi:hypothetical protein
MPASAWSPIQAEDPVSGLNVVISPKPIDIITVPAIIHGASAAFSQSHLLKT